MAEVEQAQIQAEDDAFSDDSGFLDTDEEAEVKRIEEDIRILTDRKA